MKAEESIVFTDQECRVCRGEGTEQSPLRHPCKCKGTVAFVHQECLEEWLARSGRPQTCELCGHRFDFVTKFAPNAPATLPATEVAAVIASRALSLVMFCARVFFYAAFFLVVEPALLSWMACFYTDTPFINFSGHDLRSLVYAIFWRVLIGYAASVPSSLIWFFAPEEIVARFPILARLKAEFMALTLNSTFSHIASVSARSLIFDAFVLGVTLLVPFKLGELVSSAFGSDLPSKASVCCVGYAVVSAVSLAILVFSLSSRRVREALSWFSGIVLEATANAVKLAFVFNFVLAVLPLLGAILMDIVGSPLLLQERPQLLEARVDIQFVLSRLASGYVIVSEFLVTLIALGGNVRIDFDEELNAVLDPRQRPMMHFVRRACFLSVSLAWFIVAMTLGSALSFRIFFPGSLPLHWDNVMMTDFASIDILVRIFSLTFSPFSLTFRARQFPVIFEFTGLFRSISSAFSFVLGPLGRIFDPTSRENQTRNVIVLSAAAFFCVVVFIGFPSAICIVSGRAVMGMLHVHHRGDSTPVVIGLFIMSTSIAGLRKLGQLRLNRALLSGLRAWGSRFIGAISVAIVLPIVVGYSLEMSFAPLVCTRDQARVFPLVECWITGFVSHTLIELVDRKRALFKSRRRTRRLWWWRSLRTWLVVISIPHALSDGIAPILGISATARNDLFRISWPISVCALLSHKIVSFVAAWIHRTHDDIRVEKYGRVVLNDFSEQQSATSSSH